MLRNTIMPLRALTGTTIAIRAGFFNTIGQFPTFVNPPVTTAL
jgi:hypothetical protein